MKKAIKWTLIIGGGLPALIIPAILIIPMVMDIQDSKHGLKNESRCHRPLRDYRPGSGHRHFQLSQIPTGSKKYFATIDWDKTSRLEGRAQG